VVKSRWLLSYPGAKCKSTLTILTIHSLMKRHLVRMKLVLIKNAPDTNTNFRIYFLATQRKEKWRFNSVDARIFCCSFILNWTADLLTFIIEAEWHLWFGWPNVKKRYANEESDQKNTLATIFQQMHLDTRQKLTSYHMPFHSNTTWLWLWYELIISRGE